MRIDEATWNEKIEEAYGKTTERNKEYTMRVMFTNVGSLPFNNSALKIGNFKLW